MLGNVCGTLPFPSAISAFTPRTSRSCSRGSPAISSCVRRGTFLRSACFSAERSRPLRSDAPTGRLNPKSFISFTSRTEIRWKHPSPTGFRKPTNFVIGWRRRRQKTGPDRSEGPDDRLRLAKSQNKDLWGWSNRRNPHLSMANLQQKTTSASRASSSMTTSVTGCFPLTETMTRVSSAMTFLFCSGANTSSVNFT